MRTRDQSKVNSPHIMWNICCTSSSYLSHHWTKNPPSTPTTLFVTYPVFTIYITVSATSSGYPSLPMGISFSSAFQPPAKTQHERYRENGVHTFRKLLIIPWQHRSFLDQRGRNSIYGDTRLRIRARHPMDQAMERRFRRPVFHISPSPSAYSFLLFSLPLNLEFTVNHTQKNESTYA
jgi:hypothetical protein